MSRPWLASLVVSLLIVSLWGRHRHIEAFGNLYGERPTHAAFALFVQERMGRVGKLGDRLPGLVDCLVEFGDPRVVQMLDSFQLPASIEDDLDLRAIVAGHDAPAPGHASDVALPDRTD